MSKIEYGLIAALIAIVLITAFATVNGNMQSSRPGSQHAATAPVH